MNRTDAAAPTPGASATALRNATASAHRALETHAHQRILTSDRVDVGFVAGWIDAVIPVHRALDAALSTCRDPRVGSMVRDEHLRGPLLETALDRLAFAPGSVARPACVARFAASFADLGPARLVGRWYVFEGATNGGRFLAEHVRGVLGPAADPIVPFFDPYGDSQPARWATFRQGLDAFAGALDDCIVGAQETFAFHADLFDARMHETEGVS